MNKSKLAVLIAGAALAALSVGCEANTNNDNGSNPPNVNSPRSTSSPSPSPSASVTAEPSTSAVTREEFEKNRERYQREAKESGSQVGQGTEDLWLWTKTRADLLAASNLTSTGIKIDVDKGVITLRGNVPDAAQKARAEQVAKAVENNKGVRNQLVVSAGGANSGSTGRSANQNANANVNKRD